METFSLSGTDLSGRNVDMSKSFPMKVIGGLVGAHPNLPNTAGSPMDTNSPTKKSQNSNNTTHNGDVNNTGVNIENMNFNRDQDVDDAMKNVKQYSMATGGQWLDRGTFP